MLGCRHVLPAKRPAALGIASMLKLKVEHLETLKPVDLVSQRDPVRAEPPAKGYSIPVLVQPDLEDSLR